MMLICLIVLVSIISMVLIALVKANKVQTQVESKFVNYYGCTTYTLVKCTRRGLSWYEVVDNAGNAHKYCEYDDAHAFALEVAQKAWNC